MAIFAGDFKRAQRPWQIVSGGVHPTRKHEGALEAPTRISLRKFSKRIASGAPLTVPDQTSPYSEMDETCIVTDIPENDEARHLLIVLDHFLLAWTTAP